MLSRCQLQLGFITIIRRSDDAKHGQIASKTVIISLIISVKQWRKTALTLQSELHIFLFNYNYCDLRFGCIDETIVLYTNIFLHESAS